MMQVPPIRKPMGKAETPRQPYPSNDHLRRMAERSAAEEIEVAEKMSQGWAGMMMYEAQQKGYA